jgi:peptide/nickel transport system ATP-binding protein
VDDIFRSPAHSYTRGLLGASLTLEHDLHYRDGRLAEVRAERNADTDEIDFKLSREIKTDALSGRFFGQQGVSRADTGRVRPGPLLRVTDLHAHYTRNGTTVRAVDGVSLEIARGETLGLVGESGCGKSTLSRALLRLLPVTAGAIELDEQDITHLGNHALQSVRRKVQMIFQDPFASLNPRHTVETMLDSALRVHAVTDRDERHQRILEVLRRVDLPLDSLHRYAHEFSGGQRQRIGIARALVLRPALVICDEPVSALDVSVRAQVLNLLVELKRDLGLSYLFISHDLAVVRYIADRVLIMHAGKIVEQGDHQAIWAYPKHEYTRTLIHAVPRLPGRAVLPDFGTRARLVRSIA